jgi:hypothetical protein
VLDVAFAMDGKRIVSTASDGIKIWNTETGELLLSYFIMNAADWIAITPEGFFAVAGNRTELVSIVTGLQAYSIDQFHLDALHHPDLVREKLAGDPKGLVREAAAKLDHSKPVASVEMPKIVPPPENPQLP